MHKFWLIHQSIKDRLSSLKKDEVEEGGATEEKLQEFTNEIINKITKNLDNFHYNVIIANFHEIYNFLSKLRLSEIDNTTLLENYLKILTVMNPVIPHFSSECIDQIQKHPQTEWPIIIKKFLEKKTLEIVVQLNGKKRGLISCDKNISEKQLINIIESGNEYKKYFEDKKIIKTIYVKRRLINLILK